MTAPTDGEASTRASADDALTELTIDELHARMRDGSLTSEALTAWYLDRIAAHDAAGVALNSVVTVNPQALAEAAARDAELAAGGEVGPLHGVPVLVKDAAETAGLRTTFGNTAFTDHVPEADATIVTRLREAGAVILAKTAMCDFGAGWFSSSSVSGHTRNAYDHTRDSGGSSAGTGTAVAANLGLVGVGGDTGGSVRIPSSFGNLFGLRVTTGLISRTGFCPLVAFQDTPGPMARTVADLASLLDVLVGYDPTDPFTAAVAQTPDAGHYRESLAGATFAGQRVGVLESGFGSDDDERAAPVNTVVRAALRRMAAEDVEVVPDLTIDDLAGWVSATSVYVKQSRSDLTSFFAERHGSVKSFDELHAKGAFEPLNDLIDALAGGPDDVEHDAEYLRLRLNQEEFRRAVLGLMAANGLDFVVCPTVQVVPPTTDEITSRFYTALTFKTNTVIASQTGLPALTIPVGFTEDGLPVGLELIGKPFAEKAMIQFAAAWEAVAPSRRAPVIG